LEEGYPSLVFEGLHGLIGLKTMPKLKERIAVNFKEMAADTATMSTRPSQDTCSRQSEPGIQAPVLLARTPATIRISRCSSLQYYKLLPAP
jgi:hypothetical protein